MSALPPHPNVIGLVGISPMPPSVALVTKYCARCACTPPACRSCQVSAGIWQCMSCACSTGACAGTVL